MSVDNSGLRDLQRKYEDLTAGMDELIEELVVGEGVYAVKQAKLICKNDKPDIVNTGEYRNNFHAGNKAQKFKGSAEHDGAPPRKSGTSYLIDVYNNLEQAGPLEHGFRSHFVPGHWEGRTFVHNRNDPAGGMYVGPPGGFVRGHFTLRRAIQRTKQTQEARLTRKVDEKLRERLK